MRTVLIDGNDLTLADVRAVARAEASVGERPLLERRLRQPAGMWNVSSVKGAQLTASPQASGSSPMSAFPTTTWSNCSATWFSVTAAVSVNLWPTIRLARLCCCGQTYSPKATRVLVIWSSETLLQMLNSGLLPIIPSQGSVGASGDLAPLAHLASVMIGEGEARYRGRLLTGREAMLAAGIQPLVLEAKRGWPLSMVRNS